jgi:hypothetical protein
LTGFEAVTFGRNKKFSQQLKARLKEQLLIC